MDTKIRLNKFLAGVGIGSRRKVNEIIKSGRVKVNDSIGQLNHRIDPDKDIIFLDGQKIDTQAKPIYIILNKPKGVISTTKDEFGRTTVTDLVNIKERLYPVGRLDENTTGLVILTNDGDLTLKLTHPRFSVGETYHLTIQGEVNEYKIEELKQGVKLKEGIAKAEEVKILKFDQNRTLLEIVIHQEWNRQIKKMCSVLGFNLMSLKRVGVGKLTIKDIEEGRFRELTENEIKMLRENS